MKILSLLLLLCSQAFAENFVAEKTISASTSQSFTNPKVIEFDVTALNPHLDQATIIVNGVESTVDVKLESSNGDVYTYVAVIGSNVLANGSQCDEYESYLYTAKINAHDVSDYGILLTPVSVELTYTYKYDVCHDFGSGVRETVKYVKQ